MTEQNGADLAYLVAAVCFILALKGLSSPRTARNGNLIGAFGAGLAVVTVLLTAHLHHVPLILGGIVVGAVIAVPTSRRVQMTAMPQLVALFNGVGGAAAAIVAFLELRHTGGGFPLVASLFTILVGSISFSGSVVTFLKLQEVMTTRPVVLPLHPVLFGGSAVGALALSGVAYADHGVGTTATACAVGAAVLALVVGTLFCCRSAERTSPSSSRCSTRSPGSASPRPATCSTTCCCWSPARSSARRARSSPGSWRRRWDDRSR